MKRLMIAGLIGAIAMIGASISGPAVAAEIVLKAGHGQNAGEPFDLGLKMIAEEVQKATNGNATIEIFPSMQLGGEVEMIKQVMTGTLDITAPSNAPLTNFVPELKIFDMPFLFRDEAHMIKVLRGPVLQEMNNIVSEAGHPPARRLQRRRPPHHDKKANEQLRRSPRPEDSDDAE